MISPDYVLWVVLLLMAVLASAVLYLLISSRHYQRIDYGHLLDQDERQRRLQARIQSLEQLLADLARYDRQRRRELDALIADARQELAGVVKRAHQEIVDEVLNQPRRVDSLLLYESGLEPPPAGPTQPASQGGRKAEDSRNMRNFLNSPRQQQIAAQLELGYSSQEVSRMLGVSRHEVELVGSIIFRNKSA